MYNVTLINNMLINWNKNIALH